jgi:hypothetical protein
MDNPISELAKTAGGQSVSAKEAWFVLSLAVRSSYRILERFDQRFREIVWPRERVPVRAGSRHEFRIAGQAFSHRPTGRASTKGPFSTRTMRFWSPRGRAERVGRFLSIIPVALAKTGGIHLSDMGLAPHDGASIGVDPPKLVRAWPWGWVTRLCRRGQIPTTEASSAR